MSDLGISFSLIAKEFKEEAAELLEAMENALVSIQENGMDSELINAVFRAAHTIKGTAGMYKIDYVVEFTHVAENLLDLVRNGKIALSDTIIDLLYASKDQMQNLVEYAVTTLNEVPLNEQLTYENKRLIALLEQCLLDNDKVSAPMPENNMVQDTPPLLCYTINIDCKKELFEHGMDPHSFITYLKKLGTLSNISIVLDKIPSFEGLLPTECYLSYTLLLETNSSTEQIREVFDFIEDDTILTILPCDGNNVVDVVKKVADEPIIKDEIEQSTTNSVTKTSPNNLKENILQPSTANSSSSLRVDAEKIDQLINLIGEMVIANANVVQKASDIRDGELIESVSIVSRMLEDIRESAMQIRMVQIGETFNRFKRIVLDLAKKLSKNVELTIQGGDTELDKTVIEKITDPLVHIVRNAIDHGLETPEERMANGKDPKGILGLNAYHDAGTVVIEINDNGKGLNEELILAKAIEKGLVEEGRSLSQKEIFNLILEPGFSTAPKITDLSGRGVGMDVVKRNIEALRGNIEIKSKRGEGTSFIIRLPLTLAIIDGFLVKVGETFYVIPLEMVVECLELNYGYKAEMHGNNYINLRGTILPLLNVADFFSEKKIIGGRENIVVVQYAGRRFGFIVDELYGEFQTVIKPLGRIFKNLRGISGSTILGSGKVALILDVPIIGNYVASLAGGNRAHNSLD